MLGLVNQLLDLSKVEAGALPITEVRGSLQTFVGRTVDSFRESARVKAVALEYRPGALAEAYWFDADKLERILYNLLANALDHTAAGGQIFVKLLGQEEGVELIVEDNGAGIAAEQLPQIFDRFYQVENEGTSGTGLGLALVSELVRLQQGEISVTSEIGRGTAFVVSLPYRPVESVEPGFSNPKLPPKTLAARKVPPSDGKLPLVLLVEDNDELADYVAGSLTADCRVLRAADGQQGWETALAELPDLVLSDVMMPGMDGYELCQKLKTDLRTSHIPVLLLTAKVSLGSRLEGLELGADDYLPKPFHLAELRLRIRNQLAQRERLRQQLRAELSQPAEAQTTPETSDPFLQKLYALLDEHLDDVDLSIEQLLEPLGVSRRTLQRKLKVLIGLGPAEFIRLYRLRRGAHFLRQGMSVAETAYRVGFKNPSHFTTVFRKQYQIPPAKFARQTGEN